MSLTTAAPPPTPIEPISEILHGIKVTDPYRWLEDQNSPLTRKWLEKQNVYTRAYLDAIPGRELIRKRVEELLAVETVADPWKVGNRYFFLKREARQEQPVIMMREGETGKEVCLVDPALKHASPTTSVGILSISSDANLLAYSLRQRGEDSCEVEFIDVGGRDELPDRLPRGFCRGLVFAVEKKGFYYAHETIGSTRPFYRAVRWHNFGSGLQEDIEVFFAGEDPKLRLILLSCSSSRRLGYYKLYATDPPKIDFLVHEVADGHRPRLVANEMEGLFAPICLEEQLLALTDFNAPNRRVVKIDLNHPEPTNWCDIVPQSDSFIQMAVVTAEHLLVRSVRELSTSVEMFDFTGNRIGAVALPSHGTASLFPCRTDADTVFCRFTSFAHPPAILSHRTRTHELSTWVSSQINFDPSSIETEQVRYPSIDGTPIPMFLVRQKGRKTAGPLPTFLTGYGGFGVSVTPMFTVHATYLLERGCLFAVANLRGGTEFGEAWHLAAKRRKRQTAVDDFIAAAEWLLSEGYTLPNKLAIGGGSNAGLLVGAAVTQRPELFRAVICLGPLLDMLRYHFFDFADDWIEEYGSAEIEDDFHSLLRYSPYHRVEDRVSYPAVMLISGDADTRCNPMHARKMAARLQTATSSEHPVLLDYRAEWGHRPVQPLSRRIEALTDRLGFLCRELGLIADSRIEIRC